MKTVNTFAILLLICLAFGSGYVLRATKSSGRASTSRRILYYVDPMHPAYHADAPGVAPDCGMTLEPPT
jgi:Cu(I)/Ag(I) efflux system membrane fusion protein